MKKIKIYTVVLLMSMIFSACQSTPSKAEYTDLLKELPSSMPEKSNGELLADCMDQYALKTAESYKDKVIQTTTQYPNTKSDTFSFMKDNKVYQIQFIGGYQSTDPGNFIYAQCHDGKVIETINASYVKDDQYEVKAVFENETDGKEDLLSILSEPIVQGISLNGIEMIREFPESFYVWKEENQDEEHGKYTSIHWQIVDWNQLEAQIASSKFSKVGMIFPRDLQASFNMKENGEIFAWNSNDNSGTIQQTDSFNEKFWIDLFENKPSEADVLNISKD